MPKGQALFKRPSFPVIQSYINSLVVSLSYLFNRSYASGTMMATRATDRPQDNQVGNEKYKGTMGCGHRNHWLREKVKLLQNNQEVMLGSDLAKKKKK